MASTLQIGNNCTWAKIQLAFRLKKKIRTNSSFLRRLILVLRKLNTKPKIMFIQIRFITILHDKLLKVKNNIIYFKIKYFSVFKWRCIYEDKYTVSSKFGITPIKRTLSFTTEKGQFDVDMRVYDDDQYTNEVLYLLEISHFFLSFLDFRKKSDSTKYSCVRFSQLGSTFCFSRNCSDCKELFRDWPNWPFFWNRQLVFAYFWNVSTRILKTNNEL